MAVQLDLFSPPPRKALSVSQLTGLIKTTLEDSFPSVWVSGELSDVARPQSGHVYFTLKDEGAQIRGVIWKGTAQRIKFRLDDGLAVLCHGELDVYPPRGSYQLVVRDLEPLGVGALQLAFAQLKARLESAGLFAAERKRPLPMFPRRIAFVTSPTGAAVRDFLEVLRRRWHPVEVMIIPVRVQGEGAAAEIAAGIAQANRLHPAPEVLVVGRGGGSIEDLWCFNEEVVVRAIHKSRIPVVSAVGHEIDVTLADLVADVRALTPSEAAERIVPQLADVLSHMSHLKLRLAGSLRARFKTAQARVKSLAQSRALRRPLDRLRELALGLDELAQRASRAMRSAHRREQDRLASLAGKLETLSPLGVLARGYSLTTHETSGVLITDSDSIALGTRIVTRLSSGKLLSRVEQTES